MTTTIDEAALASGTPLAGGEILQTRFGQVEWLVFNRPQSMNAMTHAMERALISAFAAINDNPCVRALILTGMSGRKPAFMAGADMGDLDAVGSAADALELERQSEAVSEALEKVRVPVVAAINGACVGMGALLAASCDVRIATPSLRFGFPIARTVGNCLSAINFARLSDLIGPARTRDLVFSTRLLPAGELQSMGALREIVAEESGLLPRAQEIAAEMAALAPLTLWGTKEILRRIRDAGLDRVEDEELLLSCYGSEDYRSAIDAFRSRRKPVFNGR